MRRAAIWAVAMMTTALVAPAMAAPAPASAAQSSSARTVVPLAEGWRFKQDNTLVGVEAPSFDDAGWQQVGVPHTWNRVGHYIPDPASHLNTAETINKTQGVGWYRLSFAPGAEFKRKRAWLEFDAAARVAEVWLNGIKLGTHAGGFSRFRLDATAALRVGANNILVVKADSSAPAGEKATLPLAGDFFVHGGLYRPARLIATDDVHVEMLDHGGPGIYAATCSIDGGTATVAVRVLLRNDGKGTARSNAVVRLVDTAGRAVAEKAVRVALPAGQTTTVEQDLVVPNAHLWNGVEDPYLYRLVVEIQAGKARDRVDQAFGIRQIRIDPEKGFFLNGKPYQLRGTGIHQDLEGKGWAMSEADFAADVAMIRELGANSLRLTHYQWGPAIHELADRTGLILWDEIPLVTLFAQGRGGGRSFVRENALQQMRELIRQNYNHASVAVWVSPTRSTSAPRCRASSAAIPKTPRRSRCCVNSMPWPRWRIRPGPRHRPTAARAASSPPTSTFRSSHRKPICRA